MIPIDVYFNDIHTVRTLNRYVKHSQPKKLLREATGDCAKLIQALSAAERFGGTPKTYGEVVEALAAVYIAVHVLTMLYGAQADTLKEIKMQVKKLGESLPVEIRERDT